MALIYALTAPGCSNLHINHVFRIRLPCPQGWSFARHAPHDEPMWSPRVLAGLALWLFGWTNVMRSDLTLINLRKPGESGYKIP